MSEIPKSEVSRHHQKVQSWCHTVDSWWKKPCASWYGSLGCFIHPNGGFTPEISEPPSTVGIISISATPTLSFPDSQKGSLPLTISTPPCPDVRRRSWMRFNKNNWNIAGLQGFSGGFPWIVHYYTGHDTKRKRCTIKGKSLKITLHLHSLIPPKWLNWMIPALSTVFPPKKKKSSAKKILK